MKRKSKKNTSGSHGEVQPSPVRVSGDRDAGGGEFAPGGEGSGTRNNNVNKFDTVILLLKGYLTCLGAKEEDETRQLVDKGNIINNDIKSPFKKYSIF